MSSSSQTVEPSKTKVDSNVGAEGDGTKASATQTTSQQKPRTPEQTANKADTSKHSSLPNRLDELDLNDLVVELKNLKFTYDKLKGNLLNDINLSFPRRAIYGFLGPSGCGKTTIIKLIVGQLRPSSGLVRINGKSPSDPMNKIPGPGVGYMPQDYSLYEEFTIAETFKYFARIYGLHDDYKKKRIEFLIKFLELPDPNRMVRVLSGGQKRRTSLAVAIIHNPPLLILDEPTVGVDPMLREKIWGYLVKISNEEKTSVLITTHYIEECRRAHAIALMRNGKLLVENSPSNLLTHFKKDSLEDVFLQVCRAEEQTDVPMPPNIAQIRENSGKSAKPAANTPKDKIVWVSDQINPRSIDRIIALTHKNSIRLLRQKLMLFMVLLLPVLAVVLFCFCIGNKPFGLDIAVYNKELENKNIDDKQKMSLQLLTFIDKKTFNLKTYSSNESAIDSVKTGETYGALCVPFNFTPAFIERGSAKMFDVSDQIISDSTILFFGDLTNIVLFQTMFQTLIKAELQFHKTTILAMNKSNNPEAMRPIIQFVDPPIYGSMDPRALDVAAPGFLLVITYCLSMALITLNLVTERKLGLLDRSLIAGARMPEILLTEIAVQMMVLILQIISLIIVLLLVFEVPCRGSIVHVILYGLVQGIAGMSFGLLLSSVSRDEDTAMMLLIGSVIPFLVISGILWPLEGMHFILRTISLFTPQTIPVIGLKSVMLKGWGIGHSWVWAGYLITIAYIVILLTLTNFFSKRKD